MPTTTALAAAALTVALAAGGWVPPTRTPSITASPQPLLRARFPGVTRVPGSVLNAVVDLLRPVGVGGGGGGAQQQPFIARRRLEEGGSVSSSGGAARGLQPLLVASAQSYLTCAAVAAGGNASGTAAPSTVTPATGPWSVSAWCFLVHLQPQVAAAFAALRGVTLLVPSDAAFARLLAGFPAFYEWLAALPSCVSGGGGGFNRAEYFLLSLAVRGNASCAGVRCTDRGTAGPFRALTAAAAERVSLGVVLPPGQTCAPGGNASCLADRPECLGWADARTPQVVAEWAGGDGGGRLSLLDGVPPPGGDARARFPPGSLADVITGGRPGLGGYAALVANAGLAGFFEGTAPGGGRSLTLFAPLDGAFARLTPAQREHLLGPAGRELARYVALSHVLAGDTYVYACALAASAATLGNVTQAMASGAAVTFSVLEAGADGQQQQPPRVVGRFPGWAGTPWSAATGCAGGWADAEATNGVAHAVDGLLLDGWAWGRLLAATGGA